jgi:hypothetical protein
LNRYDSLTEWNTLFHNALESFVEKLKQDEQVIAAVLFGSLSSGAPIIYTSWTSRRPGCICRIFRS